MVNFEKAGFRFFDYGKLKNGKKVVADYYKGDLTPESKESLKRLVPKVFFLSSQAQYAPELRSSLVCIPV